MPTAAKLGVSAADGSAGLNARPAWVWLFLVGILSMGLGWRVRGQFGHEIGAAMPGALLAMVLVLLSGRADWQRRLHFFALFGALGWAFGGSMSYMKVVGFTHSSDSPTVLYGYAALFLVGFLWASLGGAGTALPAVLSSERLASLFPALAAVFIAWFLQDVIVDWTGFMKTPVDELGARVTAAPGLGRYDCDWLQATVAIAAVVVLAFVRRRIDPGTSLVLHLAVGWWLGFVMLVLLLGLRLNPPRGDNWAGCVGVVAGVLVFCRRQQLSRLALITLMTGFLGGAAFCLGQMIKTSCIATGADWGWHTVMEWSHGLLLGLATLIVLTPLIRTGGQVADHKFPRWTEIFALLFVLWVIPYMNFRKSPALILKNVKGMPEKPFGLQLVSDLLPSRGWIGWYDALYLLMGLMLLTLLVRQYRRGASIVPESWTGKGHLLYLVVLWIVALLSFVHELPGLRPMLLAMQWLIFAAAIVCTWGLIAGTPRASVPEARAETPVSESRFAWVIALGLALLVVSSLAGWGWKRKLFGDTFVPYFYRDHIFFGPNNTNDIK